MFIKYLNKFGKAEAEWVLELLDMHDGDITNTRQSITEALFRLTDKSPKLEDKKNFDAIIQALFMTHPNWWSTGIWKLKDLGLVNPQIQVGDCRIPPQTATVSPKRTPPRNGFIEIPQKTETRSTEVHPPVSYTDYATFEERVFSSGVFPTGNHDIYPPIPPKATPDDSIRGTSPNSEDQVPGSRHQEPPIPDPTTETPPGSSETPPEGQG